MTSSIQEVYYMSKETLIEYILEMIGNANREAVEFVYYFLLNS